MNMNLEMKSTRSSGGRTSFAILAGCLAVLAAIGTAWACTVSPSLSVEPGFSTPGSLVAIRGAFIPFGAKAGQESTAGPVEIRWNSASGPQLASGPASARPAADGTNFSLALAVPGQAEPGVYYVVAVQRDATGNVIAKAAETFEVRSQQHSLSSTQRAVSGDLWSGVAKESRLADTFEATSASHQSSRYMATGVALTGLSLLALSAGTLLAVRKRKAQRNL